MPRGSRTRPCMCIDKTGSSKPGPTWSMPFMFSKGHAYHVRSPSSQSQECRQYNVLIKDEMENRKEDWVTKAMECKDGSSSDSSSEGPKRKSKGKKAPMGVLFAHHF